MKDSEVGTTLPGAVKSESSGLLKNETEATNREIVALDFDFKSPGNSSTKVGTVLAGAVKIEPQQKKATNESLKIEAPPISRSVNSEMAVSKISSSYIISNSKEVTIPLDIVRNELAPVPEEASKVLKGGTKVILCNPNREIVTPDFDSHGNARPEIRSNRNYGKEVGTILTETAKTVLQEKAPKKGLKNETQPPLCGVNTERAVFGHQSVSESNSNIVSNSKEVGTIPLHIVKIEPVSEESSPENLHEVVRSSMCEAIGFGLPGPSSSKIENINDLTELDVRLKRESEDHTLITRELVGHWSGSEVCEDQKPLQKVKQENDSDVAENASSVSADMKPHYDLCAIKLPEVSVKLLDLFPHYLRKLGKAHTNSESCLCIYCRGEYRYSDNLHHVPRNLLIKNRTRGQNITDDFGNLESSSEPSDNRFKCDRCSLKCGDRQTLNLHLRKHSNPYKCKFCPDQFSMMSSYHSHLSRSHNVDKPFKCRQCPAKFWYQSILDIHLRVHSKERPFKCKRCSATFTQECSLRVHMNVHKAKRPFKCPKCPADFKFKSNLTVHLRVHSGEKPFKCKYCPLRFLTASNLKNHTRLHTGEKPYKCKFCPLKFKQSSGMNTHIKNVHSDVRPFPCQDCSSRFKHRGSLKIHARVHSGEKPYECKQCPLKFAQSSQVNLHVKNVHCITNKLACAHCFSRYKTKSHLAHHMRKLHLDV